MQTTESDLLELLLPYHKQVEKALAHQIWPAGSLGEACRYAVMNGGKRFRPSLVLMIAKALGQNNVEEAALSIEYFHTASLVADDLPCMDDDDERRGKPAVHRVYGEGVALLTSYALITEGYACIAKQAALPLQTKLALENAAANTLLATEGQHLDLFPPDDDEKTILEALRKKTVSLFEISFVFGWIFGGGNLTDLPLVKKAAYHFGMAFQIADDIDDLRQDKRRPEIINLALKLGTDKARLQLDKEKTFCLETLERLKLENSDIAKLIQSL